MKTNHTPAPWQIHEDESQLIVTTDGYSTIAEVFEKRPGWKANARLIAAAPELLEALKVALYDITLTVEHESEYGDNITHARASQRLEKAKAAISRATRPTQR